MKSIFSFLTLLFLLYPVCSWAYTETFYLCQGGNGSAPEDGTCGNAWDADDLCLAANWDSDDENDGNLGANDLLVVMDDGGAITGSGSNVIEILGNGLSGKPITIQKQTGDSPILDGQDTQVVIRGNYDKDYITIDGLELKQGYQYTILAPRCDHWIIKNCKIHDTHSTSANNGTNVLACGSSWLIEYNEIYNTDEDHAIYFYDSTTPSVQSDDNVVQYNYIHDIDVSGVQFNGDGDTRFTGNIVRYNWFEDVRWADVNDLSCDGLLIYGNIIVKNDASLYVGIIVDGDGVGVSAQNCKIYNNTIYGDYEYMIALGIDDDGDIDSIKNNIFYNTRAAGIFIYRNSASDVVISCDYNQFYNSSDFTNAWYWGGGTDTTPDSLSAWNTETSFDGNSDDSDPLLSNPTTSLTLQATSPCINVGEDLGATYDDALDPTSSWPDSVFLVDQDGHGSGWEMGAYVFVTGGPPPTPPMSTSDGGTGSTCDGGTGTVFDGWE